MGLAPRYDASEAERRWQATWARDGLYTFRADDPRPIFAIDTPPPTVSGELHIGHMYSYVQAEAMARFWRMQGFNVYYPFGFDDNGLATERFVERHLGIRMADLPRPEAIAACLRVSREVEDRFEELWRSLGMSVDWSLRYSTIDPAARRVSQWSFLDLYCKGLVYRAQAPNPWCIECRTAIAQAEMDDAERTSTFYTLQFETLASDGTRAPLEIATTRPELLPACVAVFVHPEDARFRHLIGQQAITPLFERSVPILADATVDPAKGSGAVMCCTFGDAADVAWWRTHQLPLIALVTREGRLSEAGGAYAGLTLSEARKCLVDDLRAAGLLLAERTTEQTVRVHERCGTPLEILETSQWFVRLLDAKERLIEAGRQITWHPEHMRVRYEHWVSNLGWDWCISRQRFYGVPFPLWHCPQCGAVVLADESQLPVDPSVDAPPRACACGNRDLLPELDVMDTWATSSVSPQIAGQMFERPELYKRLVPMQLRPQAHDIIRTWAFYTIAKSLFHFGHIPWESIAISGHTLAPSGDKISKSKGNAKLTPAALHAEYGADALRYWACSGALGADQQVNVETMRQGKRLLSKLWSASRFIETHLPTELIALQQVPLLLADRALLSWLQRLIERATTSFKQYDYVTAKDTTERFFWQTLCDNYLEWVKMRLYDGSDNERKAAQATLAYTLPVVLKLFAPILPHITEELFQQLCAPHSGEGSIHVSAWPEVEQALIDPEAERGGEALLALTASVRRFKSARRLSLSSELAAIRIAANDAALRELLFDAQTDLRSVTRAQEVEVTTQSEPDAEQVAPGLWLQIALHPANAN